jgi:hypothetical protein
MQTVQIDAFGEAYLNLVFSRDFTIRSKGGN